MANEHPQAPQRSGGQTRGYLGDAPVGLSRQTTRVRGHPTIFLALMRRPLHFVRTQAAGFLALTEKEMGG